MIYLYHFATKKRKREKKVVNKLLEIMTRKGILKKVARKKLTHRDREYLTNHITPIYYTDQIYEAMLKKKKKHKNTGQIQNECMDLNSSIQYMFFKEGTENSIVSTLYIPVERLLGSLTLFDTSEE